jgi:hypothetical protein
MAQPDGLTVGLRSRPVRRVHILVTVSAMLLPIVAGCSRTHENHSGATTTPTAADTLSNGLPLALSTSSAEWFSMWRKAAPGFAPDSLIHGVRRFDALGKKVSPLDRSLVAGTDSTVLCEVMGEISPTGRHVLIEDGYRALPDPEVDNPAGGEVDHVAILIDYQRRTSDSFLFCGTPCTFDWGGWIDSTHFAVAGSESDEEATCRGFLRLYSITQNLETTWYTPSVPLSLREAYGDASDERLMTRCRAWKASHPRP